MKLKLFSILFLLLLQVNSFTLGQQRFYINLNDRDNDLFTVTIIPENLSDENNIFQFASTAPGTYQRMDIGKYVKSNNVQQILETINTTKKTGDALQITIFRDDKPIDIKLILSSRRIKHSFLINENATKEQVKLEMLG
ncbi:MAG: hypothetical protein A2V93_01970 [Ignavibacteria bacterium RBG_16_34_14]|nr:MAG: hypothetical protein A2V93_01970 [Ignavibacteria bacterium RBG_16_34_14]